MAAKKRVSRRSSRSSGGINRYANENKRLLSLVSDLKNEIHSINKGRDVARAEELLREAIVAMSFMQRG